MAKTKLVERYYDAFDEWGRMDSPAGKLEFLRTMRCLEESLKSNSRILDLGGGPGRYSIALARRGHDVDLADVSSTLLDRARRMIADAGVSERVQSVMQANATDLGGYASNTFDAVVALGPFYHLTTRDERSRAAAEIHRVLKPGGIAFVAFIPRLSGLAGLIDRAAADMEQVSAEAFSECVATGVFSNCCDRGFQEGFYASPHEMADVLASAGLKAENVQSIRSIAYGHEQGLAKIEIQNPKLFERVMDACTKLASEPSIVASCGHALCICSKSV